MDSKCTVCKKDKVKLYCQNCDNVFYQDVEFIGDIIWLCPKCKSEDVWMREYIEENPDPKEFKIVLGKGGCGRPG